MADDMSETNVTIIPPNPANTGPIQAAIDNAQAMPHLPNPAMHGPDYIPPVLVNAPKPTEIVPAPKSFMDIKVEDLMQELDNDTMRALVTRGVEAGKHYAEFIRIGTAVVRDVLDLFDRVKGGGGNPF